MNKFSSKDEFQVGKHNIGWLDSDFHPLFPDVSFEPRTLGTFQKLPRRMTDAEIESELKPGFCELGDIVAFMDNAPEECKDGRANLFYTPSFVVSVYWDSFDRGWRVRTCRRDDPGWSADVRVLSPATKPATLIPSEPSDYFVPLTLEIKNLAAQVQRLADCFEPKKKVIKKKGKKK